jgi:hypothetical protein
LEAKCVGSTFQFELTQSDAVGLYAVLTGNHGSASIEQIQTGQKIYAWFFEEVMRRATTPATHIASQEKTRKSKVA